MDRIKIRETYEDKKKKKPIARMSGREWITLVLSILAFLISLTGLYINTIRQEDYLSVSVPRPPFPRITEGNFVYDAEAFDVVLFNSGNRVASVLSMQLGFAIQEEKGRTCDIFNRTKSVLFHTSLQATIVKPNEVVVQRALITRSAVPERSTDPVKTPTKDQFVFRVPERFAKQNTITMEVCLWTNIVTPSLAEYSARTLIFEINLFDRGGFSYLEKYYPGEQTRPHVLLRQFSTLFSR